MKPLISIIIPTVNDYDKLLKPCLVSIIQYTSLHNVEIIVVNNAEKDEEESLKFAKMNKDIKLISYPKPMGYPFSINRGIEIAQGGYILLLNNDCILLEQQKNDWLNKLLTPFFLDKTVGITGVFKKHIPEINRSFILFFCALIKREVFDIIGLLDEKLEEGYGDDMDFCIRAEDAGYKVVSVPKDEIADNFEGNLYISDFQIYHQGGATFHTKYENANEIYNKNFNYFINKYKNADNISLQ